MNHFIEKVVRFTYKLQHNIWRTSQKFRIKFNPEFLCLQNVTIQSAELL